MSTDKRSTPSGERPLARFVVQPVARFLAVEAAGGLLLLGATMVALLWVNSPWSGTYHQLWGTTAALEAGPLQLRDTLGHWVDDGLMALFFFVVGLEVKRELVTGQLRERRDAVLPLVAALGGMLVPAAIFLALNAGGSGARGWGIPMATDIAFALGVLALLGDRVPGALKVLLLGLAIADDIGAIVIIAVFYADGIEGPWLAGAAAGLLAVVVMKRADVWFMPAYVVVGVVVWFCTLESGVHATIAGVALGLLTPVSVGERLETALHPWTSYLVLPIFALANAGIDLDSRAVRDAAASPVAAGIVVALVVGKLTGITAAAWLVVRSGWARLPEGVTWLHVAGMAGLAGIGFTVSIFVAGLAYDSAALEEEAKLGVLVASVLAAGVGAVLLRMAGRPDGREKNSDYGV